MHLRFGLRFGPCPPEPQTPKPHSSQTLSPESEEASSSQIQDSTTGSLAKNPYPRNYKGRGFRDYMFKPCLDCVFTPFALRRLEAVVLVHLWHLVPTKSLDPSPELKRRAPRATSLKPNRGGGCVLKLLGGIRGTLKREPLLNPLLALLTRDLIQRVYIPKGPPNPIP